MLMDMYVTQINPSFSGFLSNGTLQVKYRQCKRILIIHQDIDIKEKIAK